MLESTKVSNDKKQWHELTCCREFPAEWCCRPHDPGISVGQEQLSFKNNLDIGVAGGSGGGIREG